MSCDSTTTCPSLPTTVAQLVDADVRQTIEWIGTLVTWEYTLDDRPHGLPANSHECAERRLVGALREVRHLLLELVGEP